jgi:hypothetical protein
MDPAKRDAIRDLPAKLDARAAIVAGPTFKPTDYLGLSDTAKSSGEQGWIAWEILPYLEWLAEYVARSKVELSSAIHARVASTRIAAEQFLKNRLAARPGVSPEDRSVLEARITDLFRPTRSPGTDQRRVADGDRYDNPHSIKYIETRERDREFINAGLEVPSAWNPLPPPPDLAKSIVSQLQARGANSATILSALSEFGLANSDEAATIRQQAAEQRSRDHRYVRVRAHEIPPSVIETAFFTVANYFDAVRREWKASDEKLAALMAAGCGPETGGFESIGRDFHRSDLRWHIHKLEHDADFIPSILPYCDPSLRDDIVRMLKLLDLDSYQNNRYGEESARWRQQWEAMDLDRDLDGLIMKLRAAGDALALRTVKDATQKEHSGRVAGDDPGRSPRTRESKEGIAQNQSESGAGDEAAALAPRDLARILGVDQRALEKRLERWRSNHRGSSEFVEVANRSTRDPRFLYRLSLARKVAAGLKPSHEMSHDRRTTGN